MKILLLFSALISGCSTLPKNYDDKPLQGPPLVIAHRGLSGYYPEHTLEAYSRAIDAGADFIEPDLVSTRDGVLVARHENEISGTTDVAQKFPGRKKNKNIDGQTIEGWFTEDFSLAELGTLRAKERLASRSQANNGKFSVPTFDEVVALVKRKEKESGRRIGLYPEMKHPSYFRGIGLALEPKLAAALKKYGLAGAEAPVFVQSFEPTSLQNIRTSVSVPLVLLFDSAEVRPFDFVLANDPRTYGDLLTDGELKKIAKYAKGIGPWKQLIVSDAGPTDLVKRAHRLGLLVHPYTFRSDSEILPARYAGDARAEYLEFFDLGVDGVFSDFTDHAVQARKDWLSGRY